MKITKGTYRTVLIFENFVVKFPRIYPWKAFKNALKYFKQGYFLRCLRFNMYGYLIGPRCYLFRGILENWHEFTFYRHYQSQFLLPTYFSLFGLLNIQKFGKKISDTGKSFWRQIAEITNNEAWDDSHHFSNIGNFCEENGKLKIADYGSPYTQKILEKYGDKIFKEINFSKY